MSSGRRPAPGLEERVDVRTSGLATSTSAWPVATLGLLFALWLAFRLDYSTRVHRGIGPEPLPGLWVFDGADPKPWQFLSYAFVHAFDWHLRTNLVALAPGVMLVELRVGWARTVASFFALTGLVSLGFHLIDPRDLYGASGVAAGFFTMAAAVWLRASGRRAWVRATPLALALGYLAVTELVPALAGHPSAGWKPHLVGALCGVGLGRFVRTR